MGQLSCVNVRPLKALVLSLTGSDCHYKCNKMFFFTFRCLLLCVTKSPSRGSLVLVWNLARDSTLSKISEIFSHDTENLSMWTFSWFSQCDSSLSSRDLVTHKNKQQKVNKMFTSLKIKHFSRGMFKFKHIPNYEHILVKIKPFSGLSRLCTNAGCCIITVETSIKQKLQLQTVDTKE